MAKKIDTKTESTSQKLVYNVIINVICNIVMVFLANYVYITDPILQGVIIFIFILFSIYTGIICLFLFYLIYRWIQVYSAESETRRLQAEIKNGELRKKALDLLMKDKVI